MFFNDITIKSIETPDFSLSLIEELSQYTIRLYFLGIETSTHCTDLGLASYIFDLQAEKYL